jgi:hypothetical protein
MGLVTRSQETSQRTFRAHEPGRFDQLMSSVCLIRLTDPQFPAKAPAGRQSSTPASTPGGQPGSSPQPRHPAAGSCAGCGALTMDACTCWHPPTSSLSLPKVTLRRCVGGGFAQRVSPSPTACRGRYV